MKERIKGIFYLLFIILLTSIHHVYFYLTVIFLLITLDLKGFLNRFHKVLFSILIFNGTITLSYGLYQAFYASGAYHSLVLINLRVFALTYLAFFFMAHTNLVLLFSFSKKLSMLLAIALSQILVYQRVMEEMELSRKSRVIQQDKKILKLFSRATLHHFFIKSLYAAKETTLALRSRGVFHD